MLKVPDKDRRELSVRLSTVERQALRWVWNSRIPTGFLTLIAGDPGVGKGLVTADIAARTTRGQPWPDTRKAAPKGSVIFCSAEDDAALTLKPRLEAAHAKSSRVHLFKGTSLNHLEDEIAGMKDCRLVVVDPLSAYIGADMNHGGRVRRAMRKLSDMSARQNCAVVGVVHLKKGCAPPKQRLSGSMALLEVPRAVYVVEPMRDSKLTLFSPVKANLGPDDTACRFKIVKRTASGIETRAIAWESGSISMTAEEVFHPEIADNRKARNEAKASLTQWLKAGPLAVEVIAKKAMSEKHSWATIRRAKEELGVCNTREGFGEDGKWLWSLPA